MIVHVLMYFKTQKTLEIRHLTQAWRIVKFGSIAFEIH